MHLVTVVKHELKDKLFQKLTIRRGRTLCGVRFSSEGLFLKVLSREGEVLRSISLFHTNSQCFVPKPPVFYWVFLKVLLGLGFCEEAAGGGSGSKDDGSPSLRTSVDQKSRKRLQWLHRWSHGFWTFKIREYVFFWGDAGGWMMPFGELVKVQVEL